MLQWQNISPVCKFQKKGKKIRKGLEEKKQDTTGVEARNERWDGLKGTKGWIRERRDNVTSKDKEIRDGERGRR